MLNNADLRFGSVETPEGPVMLTHAKYAELMQNPNRQVRKDTFETYYSAFRGSLNTIAATYATSVKKDIYYARVRGYESTLEKALFADNVPVSMYDTLIGAIHDALGTMYDYIDARRKILGLSDMAMYDIYAPLVPTPTENTHTMKQWSWFNVRSLPWAKTISRCSPARATKAGLMSMKTKARQAAPIPGALTEPTRMCF